ncbi:hypothetical protein D3C72_1728540 [compost metagenome]
MTKLPTWVKSGMPKGDWKICGVVLKAEKIMMTIGASMMMVLAIRMTCSSPSRPSVPRSPLRS